MPDFTSSEIFPWGETSKRKRLLAAASVLLTPAALAALFFYYRNSEAGQLLYTAYLDVSGTIRTGTLAGSAVASFFGGLFFMFIPVEILYTHFLKSGANPLGLIPVYICGLSVSCIFNYWFGLRFSFLAKMFIAPRKFYGMKGLMNRYGGLTVFLFSATPLPSQTLVVILGAFRYRPSRTAVYFLSGKIVLYTIITIIYYYFPAFR